MSGNTIDTFKATIGKRYGLAKANRFLVIFTPPSQSLINLNPLDIIGRLASGTEVDKKSFVSDPRDIAFLVESTQLPGRNINTLDYQAEKETIKIPNGFIDDDVTMTFLLTGDYYIKDMMETWMSSIIDTEKYQVGYKKDYQTDITIQQLNDFDKNIYGIRLQNAYPINISAIELNNSGENTIQRVTITFAYDRYVPENFVQSKISQALSAIPNLPFGLKLPDKISSGLKKIRSLL
jgi:hypothetical protein